MRRFLKIFLFLIVLLIAAAIATPFLMPADKIKEEVLAQIKAKLGRDVAIDTLRFSFFPVVQLKAEGVRIGNPDWANGGNMAEIKTLDIGVELMPLLHHEVKLKNLALDAPVIALIKRQGRVNWAFGKPSTTVPSPASGGHEPPAVSTSANAIADLHLDNIAITHGTVIYRDDASDKTQTVSELDLSLKAPDLAEKADITFAALYDGRKADARLTLLKPLAYIGRGTTEVSLKASYGPLDFTWKGTAAMANGIPSLTGVIDIPSLKLTDLTRHDEAAPSHASAPASGAAPTGESHWSDTPIKLDGLKQANGDLTITLGKLILSKTTLENITAHVKLANAVLQLQIEPLKAYGGTLTLAAAANAAGAINAAFTATQAEAEPLLHDFADYDRLSGIIDLQTKFTGAGTSQRALINSLGGQGNVLFKNGKLKGVNLAALVKTPGAQGEGESTEFSEFSASYTITRGILETHDLKLLSPLLRMSGEGSANLPQWQQHFLLKPMLVASAQGQGGKDESGIVVPVIVDGPLNHPSYRPDLQSALQENLKNPDQLKQNLKNLNKTLINRDTLKNLLR